MKGLKDKNCGSSTRKSHQISTQEEPGVVMLTPEGDKIECMIRLDFPTTNNKAEYEALIAGLDLAKAAGAKNVIIHCDS